MAGSYIPTELAITRVRAVPPSIVCLTLLASKHGSLDRKTGLPQREKTPTYIISPTPALEYFLFWQCEA